MRAVADEQVSISVHNDEIGAGVEEDEEVTSRAIRFHFSRFGSAGSRVGFDGEEFKIVASSFESGLGSALRTRARVVDVYRCCDSELPMSRARREAFRIHAEAVRRTRGGDANVRQGWFGASREEIGAVVAHGFGGGACGRAVCLSAVKFAADAVMAAEEDAEGLRHVLMCRVILGKQEQIAAGSDQCYPSSTEFDTGVDSLYEPRKYIIWSAYSNVYILPSYIVSFKINYLPRGLGCKMGNVAGRMRPTSAWVKFSNLVTLLGRVLPQSQMAEINRSYKDFCDKRIGRPQMIQKLRLVAGDKLLAATIKYSRDGV